MIVESPMWGVCQIEIMTNIADNFHRAGIKEESQVRESIAGYIGLVDVTKEHYWDWDY